MHYVVSVAESRRGVPPRYFRPEYVLFRRQETRRDAASTISGLYRNRNYVTDVAYASEYKLLIQFEDGETKPVDLGPHLDGPVFEPLRGMAYFKSFQLNSDIDTVVWPNNADFSPDFLYSVGMPVRGPAQAVAVPPMAVSAPPQHLPPGWRRPTR